MASQTDLCFPQQAVTQIPSPNPTTETTQRHAGPNFFRDGENVQFMRTDELREHRVSDDGRLELTVKTHQQVNRTAQTHDSVMHQFVDVPEAPGTLYFEVSFFTEKIFRVKFAGSQSKLQDLNDNPTFPPEESRMLVGKPHKVATTCATTDDTIKIASPYVELVVQKKPFRLEAFSKGSKTPFWQQRLTDLFTSDVVPTSIAQHEGRVATFESFSLKPKEELYGLGERFDSVARIGRPVDFVNHDAIGTSNTRSYINVPFFWSTAGYGCFVNSTARTEWDLGRSEQGTAGFCTEEEHMDYFIIHGKNPGDILGQYATDLTGNAPVLPTWTFGLWLSRNSYESWDVVDGVLAKANETRIPVDDIHLDTYWFKEDWNPDLIWDDDRFRNHEAKLAELKKDGVRVSLWQYSFAPPREDNSLFVEGNQKGFFGMKRNADGSRGDELFSYPEGSSGWKIDDAVIDFSNPDAREWYGEKISRLIREGAGAIKTDFGDCIPPDAWYQNIEGRRFQNLFSLVYNATVWNAMKSVDSDAAIWARSGTAGSQRYPVHWGGDSQCSWSALQGTLRATLSVGLSGFPFFSHDIGGFIGRPDAELYVRWAQLGLLGASHSRSHGAGNENSREPWSFGDEALNAFRKMADLRYRLLPYLVQQARDGAAQGLPVIRHLILQWPEDRNVRHIETQYMLGAHVMVAPVLQPRREIGESMDVYFPRGTWYTLHSAEKFVISTGEWREVPTPALDEMAMWVREGATICYAQTGRLRTWGKAGPVTEVEVYGPGPQQGEALSCPDGDGGHISVTSGADGQLIANNESSMTVHHYK